MDSVVKASWGERFINWLIHSKTLRQKMGKRERIMDCIQLDKLVFDDVSPFLEGLRSEATAEGYDAAVTDVVSWFKALFPECHGIIHRIQGGETKGFRDRATAKGWAQKVGHA